MYTPPPPPPRACAVFSATPKTLGYPLPLLISRAVRSPGSCEPCTHIYIYTFTRVYTDPHFFFRFPLPSSVGRSSKIVSFVFYNVVLGDAF